MSGFTSLTVTLEQGINNNLQVGQPQPTKLYGYVVASGPTNSQPAQGQRSSTEDKSIKQRDVQKKATPSDQALVANNGSTGTNKSSVNFKRLFENIKQLPKAFRQLFSGKNSYLTNPNSLKIFERLSFEKILYFAKQTQSTPKTPAQQVPPPLSLPPSSTPTSVASNDSAPSAKTENASVAKTENASVAKTENASVAKTENASVAKTENASVAKTEDTPSSGGIKKLIKSFRRLFSTSQSHSLFKRITNFFLKNFPFSKAPHQLQTQVRLQLPQAQYQLKVNHKLRNYQQLPVHKFRHSQIHLKEPQSQARQAQLRFNKLRFNKLRENNHLKIFRALQISQQHQILLNLKILRH